MKRAVAAIGHFRRQVTARISQLPRGVTPGNPRSVADGNSGIYGAIKAGLRWIDLSATHSRARISGPYQLQREIAAGNRCGFQSEKSMPPHRKTLFPRSFDPSL